MTQEELITYHEHSFDAFCKKAIRYASADAHRERKKQQRMEVDIDDPMVAYIDSIQTHDAYTLYSRVYYVKNQAICVRDRNLGEALQYIIPKKRDVILLSFFAGYNDSEVARIMKISPTSVARRKASGIARLRELLEVRNRG